MISYFQKVWPGMNDKNCVQSDLRGDKVRVSKKIYIVQLSSRTFNVLNTLVPSEQIRIK